MSSTQETPPGPAAAPGAGSAPGAVNLDRDRDALLVIDLQPDFMPGGALAVGRDGRLTGAMPLKLREPGKALGVLQSVPEADDTAPAAAAAVDQARAQGSTANLNLVFQAGVATLGPVKVGPPPKVK